MSRHRGFGGCRGLAGVRKDGGRFTTTINVGAVNVTNVTNITNVTHVSTHVHHGGGHKGRHSNKRGAGLGRPPKLFRFCASGGLLDSDKVYGMSDGAIMHEGAKVVSYSARKLGHHLSGMGGGVCQIVEGVAKGVSAIVGAIVNACR